MRSVEFHPEAEAELVSATQYFERHVENLGLDFILAVRRAYERILEFPDSGRPFGRRLRRTLVPGFPYGLLYRERSLRTVTNNTRLDGRQFLAEAARLAIRTHVQSFPLAEANQALDALAHDAVRGAAVLLVE